jgi:hypothetical protein
MADVPEVPLEVASEPERFGKRVALSIAVLAALLAWAGVGGNNAAEEALHANIQSSDLWAFFQAKTIRQTAYRLALDGLEGSEAPGAEARREEYRRKIAEFESEPGTGEGRQELMARAREQEALREAALVRDERFDLAETLLQVAIVIASVAILARVRWVWWLGLAVGAAGAAALGAASFVG